MRILEKLIRAGWQRKTRFRDEKNNPILISDLRFIFPAVYEYIRLKLNIPSHVPIVNYSALKIFKTLTKHKKLKVLEFGSGRSTLWWLKQNILELVSIENDKNWHSELSQLINSKNEKFRYLYNTDALNYCSPVGNEKFDLIIADGMWRDECLKNSVINNCHNETVIYLDDSDKSSSIFEHDHVVQKVISGKGSWNILENTSYTSEKKHELRLADNFLRNWSMNNDRYVLAVRNFSPTQLFVKEGTFSIPRTKEMKQQLSKFIF